MFHHELAFGAYIMNSFKFNDRFKLILIEDDPHTLDNLSWIIRQIKALELIGTAQTASEGKELLFLKNPDVALIDLGLPDASGIELIHWLSENKPNVQTIVITAFADDDHVMRSLEAGASGYLLKDSSPEDLHLGIIEVMNGGSPISPLVARQLLKRLKATNPPPPSLQSEVTGHANPDRLREVEALSDRELSVLERVSRGFTSQEIAAEMGISVHTVSTHVKRIYKKLQVSSRAEAIFEASHLGLLNLKNQPPKQ